MTAPTSISIPYPWQQAIWQRLQQQIAQDKVPHAILLSGQKGIGKWHFAQALADYLLCASPRVGLACGECRHCQLLIAETHPDKQVFCPEEPGKPIKIEQIRQLSTFVSKTSQQGGCKVVLLGPVERLNVNAANALLKSLEEPAGDTIMLLTSHVTSGVMATIRSRCQLLSLSAPTRSVASEWLGALQVDDAEALLDLAGGAPLIAKEMAEGDYLEHLQRFVKALDSASYNRQNSPDFTIISDWLLLNIEHIIEWWLQVIQRILHTGASSEAYEIATQQEPVQNSEQLGVSEYIGRLTSRGVTFNKQWLFKFFDKLLRLKNQQLQGANPNKQLLLEELLLDWQAIVQRS